MADELAFLAAQLKDVIADDDVGNRLIALCNAEVLWSRV
jgi:hypothetical protein